MLAAGEDRVQRRLLQRRADRRSHLRALADDVEAADRRPPARGRQQRCQHQNRRRLARPVGAEEAVDLARRDGEVDAVHGSGSFPELAHQLLDLDRGAHIAHARHST